MSKYFNQTHKVGFAILVSIAFLFACKTEKVEWIEIDAGDGVYEYYTVLKSDSDYKDGPFFKIENKTDTIEKGTYVANQLDGQRVLYYPGGQVKIIENYIEGIYSGSYLSYYENGALKQSASFENNQMNGS